MAKERPLDKDKSIGINAPVEELEVKSSGRYYPLEYSSMIAIHNQGNQTLSEIPKSFAKIVESFDEYRNNQYTENEQQQIAKDKIQIRLDLSDREQELKTLASNDVYDEYKRMDSEVTDTLNRANNEDASNRFERVAELLATKYKDTDRFADNTYGKQIWSDLYNKYSTSVLNKAKDADNNYIDFKAGANIMDAFNVVNMGISKGAGIVDSFNDFASNISMFVNDRNNASLTKEMGGYWNKMVETRKNYILKALDEGTITGGAAAIALQDLADMSPKYEYTYLDKNNKPILDSEGNPRTGVVTTSADTQNSLLAAIKTLKSNSSGTGNGNIVDYEKDFKDKIGYDQIVSEGFSEQLFDFPDTAAMDQFLVNKAADVLNSDASASTKTKTVRNMMEAAALGNASISARTILSASGGRSNNSFNEALSTLESMLTDTTLKDNPNFKGWGDYQLTFMAANGEQVNIPGPPKLVNIPGLGDISRLGDVEDSAKLYWIRMAKSFREMANTFQDGNPSEMLFKSNKAFYDTQTSIQQNLNATNLISDGNRYNTAGAENLANEIQVGDLVALKSGFTKCSLPDKTIEAFAQSYNNAGSEKDKFISSMTIAKGLIKSGHSQDIFRYSEKNKGTNNEAMNALKSAIYLSNLKDNDVTFYKLVDLYKGPYATPQGKQDILNQFNALKETSLYSVTDLINKSKIPQNHKGPIIALSELIMQEEIAAGHGNSGIEKVGKLIKANFVKFNNKTGLNTSVFIDSPIFKGMNPNDNKKYIEDALSSYLSICKNGFSMGGQKNRANNLTIIPDEEIGNFRLAENIKGTERPFTTYFKNEDKNDSSRIETRTAPSAIFNFAPTKYDAKVVGRIEGLKAITGLYTNDSTMADLAIKNKDTLNSFYVTESIKPWYSKKDINIRSPHKLKDYYTVDSLRKEMAVYNMLLEDDNKKMQLLEDLTTNTDNGKIKSFSSDDKQPSIFMQYLKQNDSVDSVTAQELEKLRSKSSYAGKVDQSNTSVPLTQAAIGNTDYIDIVSSSEQVGLNIDGTDINNIIPSNEGTITGGAAGIDESALNVLDNKELSKEEIEKEIRTVSRKYNMNPDLMVAMATQESGLRQKAKSGVGAIGVMQLMPATAKGLGVDPYDVHQNIEGGVKYLASKYKEWGSFELALAAYNAGSGNVRKHRGIPPFKETQNYVKNIMARVPHLKSAQITYPVTYSFRSNPRFINNDTDMLSLKALNDSVYIWQKGKGFGADVVSIGTNRPELLENKPEYIDYKKFRDLKNSEGKPLFVKSEFNGFKVNVKNKQNKDGSLDPASYDTIAQDMVKTQCPNLPQANKEQAHALLKTFENNYKKGTSALQDFGLANLNLKEYNKYGIPIDAIKNPIMQARVLMQEFQRATDILGSEAKAVYALAGGSLHSRNGAVKTWREIKEDKKAFYESWFIKPTNSAQQKELTYSLEQYNKARFQRYE